MHGVFWRVARATRKTSVTNGATLPKSTLRPSGSDLKSYAERAGKARTTLSTKVKAYRVLTVTDIRNEDAQANWSQLSQIHAAPKWLWRAMVGNTITPPEALGGPWAHRPGWQSIGKAKGRRHALPWPWRPVAATPPSLRHQPMNDALARRLKRLEQARQKPAPGYLPTWRDLIAGTPPPPGVPGPDWSALVGAKRPG